MRHTLVGVLLAAFALVGAGCVFDPRVPDDAMLLCATDAECFDPDRCQISLGVCVDPEAYDPEPPAVVTAELTIVPDADNAHPAPTALGLRSRVVITFTSSEELPTLPQVIPSSPLSCSVRGVEGRVFEASCRLSESSAPQLHGDVVTFDAQLRDAVNNRARTTLPDVDVVIDTEAPPAPDVDSEDTVVLRRAPWGTQDDAEPRDVLTGAVGAAADAEFVNVATGADARGVIPVASDGSFGPSRLSPVDSAQLDLRSVDGAGNESATVSVVYGRFVASFGGKVLDSARDNPHRARAVTATGRGTDRRDGRALAAADGISADDGDVVTVFGGGTWRRVGQPLPSTLGSASVFYDARRARIARFGGVVLQEVYVELLNEVQIVGPPLGLAETWERGEQGFSPQPLIDPELDGAPAGRVRGATAWDNTRGKSYLVGGNLPSSDVDAIDPTDGSPLEDAWEYDGLSWRRLPDVGARSGAFAFVHPVDGALHVGGGRGLLGAIEEELALVDGAWQAPASDDQLPPRAYAAGAQALHTDAVWLFGGLGPDGSLSDGLFSLADGGWEEVTTAGGPSARQDAALVVEPSGSLLLFGGTDETGATLGDFWRFEAGAWSAAPFEEIPQLASPALVYDWAREELVLVSSDRVFGSVAGGAFVEYPATVDPEPGFHVPLACADALGGCVLFDRRVSQPLRLTATGWVPADDLAVGAPFLRPRIAAWDAANEELVVVGLDTWTWSSAAGWSAAAVATPAETPIVGRSSTLLSTSLGLVLASTFRTGVSVWDGSAWSASTRLDDPDTAQPVNASQWATVISTDTGLEVQALKIIEFQFREFCTLPLSCPVAVPVAVPTFTHRWSTADATSFSALSDLGGRSALGATSHDPTRGVTLSFGGMTQGSNKPLSSVHAAESFVPLAVSDADGDGAPPGRLATAAGYWAPAESHVLFSGTTSQRDWGAWQTRVNPELTSAEVDEMVRLCLLSGAYNSCMAQQNEARLPTADLDDTWLFSAAAERPALLADFDLPSASLPPGTHIELVSVRAAAGADGDDAGSAVTGARLRVFRDGSWSDLATNADPASSPGLLEGELPLEAELVELLRYGDELPVAIEPIGSNGGDAAELAVDFVVIELAYRLP